MTISLPSSIDLAIRAARPEDAEAISACYRDAYPSPSSNHSAKAYPFPQFMDPKWVQEAVTRDTVRWIVAEINHEVVGSIGAVRNIGTSDDRIAELFGLVIPKPWRGKKIATRLFIALTESLNDSCFLIGETRTATEGGWRIVKRQGFVPCGFEPFAHTTPAGSEPMLLLGQISQRCSAHRDTTGQTSVSAGKLAEKILATCQLKPLATTVEQSYPTIARSWSQLRKHLRPTHASAELLNLSVDDPAYDFRITENAALERRLQIEWQQHGFHLSGIVGLNRLEGENPEGARYSEKSFVGHIGPHPVACSRLVWDYIDRRARILCLHTLFHGLQGLMLAAIVNSLQAASSEPRTIVIDARADCPALHSTLEQLGFFPTVYYPSLISGMSGRIDAVQFTRLSGSDFAENLRWIDEIHWPEARDMVEVITNLASAAATNRAV